MGTPVDPTPEFIQRALADAADAPGYPTTYGTPRLREAAAGWLRRRLGVAVDPAAILPVIGTKELVAWLPTLLGLGTGDTVAFPTLAYPTYDVGVRLAGATPRPADSLTAFGPERVRLMWLNSPANPTGAILPPDHLRKVVDWARDAGTIVASDECYIELAFDEPATSVLHPSVCGDSHRNLLAVYSLSKRSSLAGYRAGFVAGDPDLINGLLEIRRHAGMIVPAPVQAAMAAALDDDEHVVQQVARYANRRKLLRSAFEEAGYRIEHSNGALYLWATRDEPCWDSVAHLAENGILVGPGEFYGPRGSQHIRVSITATDERVSAAAERLTAGTRSA